MKTAWPVSGFVSAIVAVALAGCTTAHYRQAADQEAYEILDHKRNRVLEEPGDFSIDSDYTGRDPETIKPEEVIGSRQSDDKLVLTLADALATGIAHSRPYQTRKENLYLSALALTAERYEFDVILGAEVEASRSRANSDERQELNSQITLDKLLKSGANIGVTIANDLLEFTTGDPRRSATSLISVNLVQPLMRGYGPNIVGENLTQAERDVIYEVREFTRFQRTFGVDIVSRYYRLLQQQDTVRNEYNNYQNLVRARQRAEALSVDRLPEFQVDQTRQDELRARNRYIIAVESYQNDLDSFKQLLGLPLTTQLQLDNEALAELTERGLIPLPVDEDAAFLLAVDNRLDFLNAIDRVDDAKRKIVVAADALEADLDFFANYSLTSTGDTQWERFRASDNRSSFGVRLKLPLDRLRERNAYRRSFIQFERNLRDLSLEVDVIYNEIRNALRTLERARKNHAIQQASVQLAQRRVESANLLLEAGRAETRDLLEAQNAQLQARNALTETLVDYHLARLNFLRDVGQLDLSPDGLVSKLELPETEAPPADNDDVLPPPDEIF